MKETYNEPVAKVKPKKHLGQHFLKDENIAYQIVQAMDQQSSVPVFEIGAGMGVLTKHLIKQEQFPVFALDVDQESITYLKMHYPDHAASFLLSDFLNFEIPEGAYRVIGNFPYNISSQIFFRVWDERSRVEEVVCMIQKEVADRICAPHGNKTYGILSVLLQAFFEVEKLFDVPPDVFDPPPKVMSSVIRLTRNQVTSLSCDEVLFKRIVKAGFGKRRKTLRNALKELNLSEEVRSLDVMNLRAEQLSVDDFISLTQKIA